MSKLGSRKCPRRNIKFHEIEELERESPYQIKVKEIQQILQHMQKQYQCPICLDLIENPQATDCGHFFCKDCIKQHINFTNKKKAVCCPLCKETITRRGLTANEDMGGIASAIRNLGEAFKLDVGRSVFTPSAMPTEPIRPNLLQLNNTNSGVDKGGTENKICLSEEEDQNFVINDDKPHSVISENNTMSNEEIFTESIHFQSSNTSNSTPIDLVGPLSQLMVSLPYEYKKQNDFNGSLQSDHSEIEKMVDEQSWLKNNNIHKNVFNSELQHIGLPQISNNAQKDKPNKRMVRKIKRSKIHQFNFGKNNSHIANTSSSNQIEKSKIDDCSALIEARLSQKRDFCMSDQAKSGMKKENSMPNKRQNLASQHKQCNIVSPIKFHPQTNKMEKQASIMHNLSNEDEYIDSKQSAFTKFNSKYTRDTSNKAHSERTYEPKSFDNSDMIESFTNNVFQSTDLPLRPMKTKTITSNSLNFPVCENSNSQFSMPSDIYSATTDSLPSPGGISPKKFRNAIELKLETIDEIDIKPELSELEFENVESEIDIGGHKIVRRLSFNTNLINFRNSSNGISNNKDKSETNNATVAKCVEESVAINDSRLTTTTITTTTTTNNNNNNNNNNSEFVKSNIGNSLQEMIFEDDDLDRTIINSVSEDKPNEILKSEQLSNKDSKDLAISHFLEASDNNCVTVYNTSVVTMIDSQNRTQNSKSPLNLDSNASKFNSDINKSNLTDDSFSDFGKGVNNHSVSIFDGSIYNPITKHFPDDFLTQLPTFTQDTECFKYSPNAYIPSPQSKTSSRISFFTDNIDELTNAVNEVEDKLALENNLNSTMQEATNFTMNYEDFLKDDTNPKLDKSFSEYLQTIDTNFSDINNIKYKSEKENISSTNVLKTQQKVFKNSFTSRKTLFPPEDSASINNHSTQHTSEQLLGFSNLHDIIDLEDSSCQSFDEIAEKVELDDPSLFLEEDHPFFKVLRTLGVQSPLQHNLLRNTTSSASGSSEEERKLIRHLQKLSLLKFDINSNNWTDEDEIQVSHLRTAIKICDQLFEVDLTNEQPLYQLNTDKPIRLQSDEIEENMPLRKEILSNSNFTTEEYILAPPIPATLARKNEN